MRKFELDFTGVEDLITERNDVLCFFRPIGSKLFRLAGLPSPYIKNTELVQVLNTFSVHGHPYRGAWYIRLRDFDDWETFASTLIEMDLLAVYIEKDADSGLFPQTETEKQKRFN